MHLHFSNAWKTIVVIFMNPVAVGHEISER
jgi:hypothetical protein